ncbi:ribonuclease III [Herbiconiux moechotypicola]|uniref:Ribonuclease 3 n=1 Tax=Herbiconiux moechotypicola TaxID=637393 RepID=A0ABN3E6J8_9MICO|nr:ribonuclease III [Herbiconiux moechotypicola]MCS5731933.1 ribonuclease III [Herbiconiux moechotypicola]
MTSESGDVRSHLLATLQIELDADLLDLALTHRSYSYEHGGVPTNERLEFLGDSVLGQAVTVMLYRDFPDLGEGELAKRRASLVSTVALADIARGIGLGEHLKLGRGEERTGGRDKASILADTMEAVIGATYLDRGPEIATALVLRLVAPLRNDPRRFGVSMDPKTSLQERAALSGYAAPVYLIAESGPDHRKSFSATVTVTPAPGAKKSLVELSSSGEGSSKKQAESVAAAELFEKLAPFVPSAPLAP